jgi:hypothetical protein
LPSFGRLEHFSINGQLLVQTVGGETREKAAITLAIAMKQYY